MERKLVQLKLSNIIFNYCIPKKTLYSDFHKKYLVRKDTNVRGFDVLFF